MSFTDAYASGAIAISGPLRKSYALTANLTLEWPIESAATENVLADITEFTGSTASLSVTLPDARQGSSRISLLHNGTSQSVTLKDASGASLGGLTAGITYALWLRTNSTAAGTWNLEQFSAGTPVASSGALASATVIASGATLVQAMPVSDQGGNYTIGLADRGWLINATGGAATFTLPAISALSNGWYVSIRNSGDGTLTIDCAGSDTVDEAGSFDLDPTEAATIVCDGTDFITHAKTIAISSSFTFLSLSVAGTGTFTLAAPNLGYTAYRLTGVLTGNRNFVVPTTAAQFEITNATSGAFSLTVKTAAGTGIVVPQGGAKIVYCDGTNVVQAELTSVSGTLAIADGGTGATTASSARTNLGATALGTQLFTAASASAARGNLGSGTAGDALFVAATAATARTALGFTTAMINRAYTSYATYSSHTTAMPTSGDTIVPDTRGEQILTASITPASITTRIRVRALINFALSSSSEYGGAALFIAGTGNCLASVHAPGDATAGRMKQLVLEFEHVPASVSSQTYAIRVGPSSVATMYINGDSSSRIGGGHVFSTLVLEEIIP